MAAGSLYQQLLLLALEALLVASLLLLLFRLRPLFGLAPIHTTLGVFYQMATLLAAAVYVQVGEDFMMSPGSVVLFPASLLAVLFVYIREDALEARKLIYALVAANLVVGLLGLLASNHLNSPGVFNPLGVPAALFIQQPRLLAVGTLALLADTILIILVYEFLGRYLSRQLFLRLYLSMTLVLWFDTVVFVTGGFFELPRYQSILLSGIVGKSVVAILYAALLCLYLRRFDISQEAPSNLRRELRDLFHLLTYREKYEALKAQSNLDPLTGVFHRGFFDASLEVAAAGALRSGAPLTVLMVDVDHFKAVNDNFGHAEGDKVLMAISAALKRSVRAADLVARHGGEEFAVMLPDTGHGEGEQLAERIRTAVPVACYYGTTAGAQSQITVTVGVATLPGDASDARGLLRAADERLYEGKRAGRNRVVAGAHLRENKPAAEPVTKAYNIKL